MYHYTYLIQYEDGRLYHGVRSCKCDIEEDNYFGSSKHTPNDEAVTKHILTEHESRDEALEEEVWYHKEYDVKSHKDYYNKANQTSTRFEFDWTGKKHSKETLKQMSINNTKEKHPMWGKKGRDNPNFGSKRSAKALKNMSGTNNPNWGTSSPMSDPKWQRECPHCSKTMAKSNFVRYHGDNCKLKGE